jgi:AraC-like DNA-binding protein
LVPLLENLVAAIQPYADANFVKLYLVPVGEKIEICHHPENIIPNLTKIISRIIAFTPQEYDVQLEIPQLDYSKTDNIVILISNTGANLEGVKQSILSGVGLNVSVHKLKPEGTQFTLYLPQNSYDDKSEVETLTYQNEQIALVSPFYKKLKKHLKNHFTSISNLEQTADAKSQRDGIFFKKVNAVINAHLDKEGFDTVTLGRALALSRTQLYRRLKPLIGFSPAHYIRFVRLSKARELLKKEDLTVSEVAYKTGFASHSHFTRAFSKQFGFKPSEMRELQYINTTKKNKSPSDNLLKNNGYEYSRKK